MLLHMAFYSKISGADKFVNDFRNVCTCKTANRTCKQILAGQRAKKVVFDSPGLVDFVIGLVNSVFNLPVGQVKYERTVKSILLVKKFLGLVKMTSWLVNASFSLPEWQGVKMIFFAPCRVIRLNYTSHVESVLFTV